MTKEYILWEFEGLVAVNYRICDSNFKTTVYAKNKDIAMDNIRYLYLKGFERRVRQVAFRGRLKNLKTGETYKIDKDLSGPNILMGLCHQCTIFEELEKQ